MYEPRKTDAELFQLLPFARVERRVRAAQRVADESPPTGAMIMGMVLSMIALADFIMMTSICI